MFENELFWIGISFIIFVALAFKPVSSIISNLLDKRANDVKFQLEQATKLKQEAENLLAEYKLQQENIADEAKKTIQNAEQESIRITKEAEENLDILVAEKVEQSLKKISNFEQSILIEIKANAVDIIVSTIRELVEDHVSEDVADELVQIAIDDISKSIH